MNTVKTESLTKELVESHLMSCIDIHSQEQRDGVTRYAWALNEMAEPAGRLAVEDREWSFEFSSRESATNFALMWIRQNRPDLEKAAVAEAREGMRYRASKVAERSQP